MESVDTTGMDIIVLPWDPMHYKVVNTSSGEVIINYNTFDWMFNRPPENTYTGEDVADGTVKLYANPMSVPLMYDANNPIVPVVVDESGVNQPTVDYNVVYD
jgi:hypothetical protein